MTIFSSVTATLSPELASCLGAKGKSWNDAFFDSLYSLVGVKYLVQKRDNYCQIRGEWNGIKKAYSILSKVAVIEKDFIEEIREKRTRPFSSKNTPINGKGNASKRRGRPPKEKPNTQPPESETSSKACHNSKLSVSRRKRGRPRKLNIIYEPFVNQDPTENVGSTSVLADIPSSLRARRNSQDSKPDIKEPLKEEHNSMVVDSISASSQLSVSISETVNCVDQPYSPEKPSNVMQDISYKNDASSKTRPTDTDCQEKDSTIAEKLRPQKDIIISSAEANGHQDDIIVLGEKSEIPPAPTLQTAQKSSPLCMESPLTNTVPESLQGITDDRDFSQLKRSEILKTASIELPSNQIPHTAEKALGEPSNENLNQNSEILDYLGIKHKNAITDLEEDNGHFLGEESKKLEELVEKMINKIDKTLVDQTKQRASTGLKYICTECPFTSCQKTELRNHMKQSHMDIDSLLEQEKESQTPVLEVKTDPTKRTGSLKLHKCSVCKFNTNSRQVLKNHKQKRHKEKRLDCDICLDKFETPRDLAKHIKEHKDESDQFSCETCGKKYKQLYVFKRHQETHKEGYVKPVYPCDHCAKTFSAKQVLQAHIDSVHLGKKSSYPCESCDRKFTTKHSLAEHQLIHSNVKPFKCQICCKFFRHESTLKTHERLHTDTTQEHTCEYCGKAFRLRSSLRIHRNIHTAEKRFDCPVCKKVFTQKQSLLRHARIHTGEKPFQCEVCGTAFYDYSILRRHVTGVHKMQWKSPTQHYVLPPDNYKDGKVIDSVPPGPLITAKQTKQEGVKSQGLIFPRENYRLEGEGDVYQGGTAQDSLGSPAKPSQYPVSMIPSSVLNEMTVYQSLPVSHTPLTLPQQTHTLSSVAQHTQQNLRITQRMQPPPEVPSHNIPIQHIARFLTPHSTQLLQSSLHHQELATYQAANVHSNVYRISHENLSAETSPMVVEPSPSASEAEIEIEHSQMAQMENVSMSVTSDSNPHLQSALPTPSVAGLSASPLPASPVTQNVPAPSPYPPSEPSPHPPQSPHNVQNHYAIQQQMFYPNPS